jgi:hypothetical protein
MHGHAGGIMIRKYLILLLLFSSGCVQLPPSPQDIDAKRFTPVADKAVIYIVRSPVDSRVAAQISLSGAGSIATHPGTYYRWEVAPGTQRIEASGASTAAVTLQTEAGKIYFVRHTAAGGLREGLTQQWLQQIDDATGRRMVNQAELL